MTTTVEAVYEDGVLKLPDALPIPEKSKVTITIQTDVGSGEDFDRATWLKLGERTLKKAWAEPDDEIFNELLQDCHNRRSARCQTGWDSNSD